ncbi:MAG: hypothetical protein HZC29_05670 [Thaumarchaeota archaeon]|nr:hypothetical protein [Nitrososphaerota archaeon]
MTNNNFIRKYYPMLTVVIGFVLVLVVGFFVFKFGVEKESYSTLCKDFPKAKNEISCEEAAKIALGKYPGDIYEVRKSTPDGALGFWLVRIHLKDLINTFDKVEIVIGVEGEILNVGYILSE